MYSRINHYRPTYEVSITKNNIFYSDCTKLFTVIYRKIHTTLANRYLCRALRKVLLSNNATPHHQCLLLSMNLLLFQHLLHIKLHRFSFLVFQISNHHRTHFFKTVPDHFCQILECQRDVKHHKGNFGPFPPSFNSMFLANHFIVRHTTITLIMLSTILSKICS